MTEPSTKAREMVRELVSASRAYGDVDAETEAWDALLTYIADLERRAPHSDVREALEEILPEVPPEDWSPTDGFGDPQGYPGIIETPDMGNRGDLRAHAFVEAEWRLVWKIRNALRGLVASPATGALEALRGLSRRVRDHIVACHRTTATGAEADEIVGQIQETKAELNRYHDEVVVPLLGEEGGGS